MERAPLMKQLFPLCDFTMAQEGPWKKKTGEGGRKRRHGNKFAFFCQCSLNPEKDSAVWMITCISSYHKSEPELLRKMVKWARYQDLVLSLLWNSFGRFFNHWKHFQQISPSFPSMKVISCVADWCFLIPILNTTAFFWQSYSVCNFSRVFVQNMFFFFSCYRNLKGYGRFSVAKNVWYSVMGFLKNEVTCTCFHESWPWEMLFLETCLSVFPLWLAFTNVFLSVSFPLLFFLFSH